MKKNTVIVTGATGAIGHELTRTLAAEGYPVIMAVRNTARGQQVADAIAAQVPGADIGVMRLDLEDENSVREFAGEVKASGVTLHALVNNAGIMNREYRVNAAGVESTMAVNLLGTVLLSLLVEPMVEDGGSIVFTTSMTRKLYRGADIDIDVRREDFSQLGTYGRSKAALTRFAVYMAQEYPRLRVNCADPGIVNSNMITMKRWYDGLANLFFRPFIRTPRQGAEPTLRALTLTGSGNIATRRRSRPIGCDTAAPTHRRLIASILSRWS